MLKSSSLTRFSMMSQLKRVSLEGQEQTISSNKYLKAFTQQFSCMAKREVAKHSLWKDTSTPKIKKTAPWFPRSTGKLPNSIQIPSKEKTQMFKILKSKRLWSKRVSYREPYENYSNKWNKSDLKLLKVLNLALKYSTFSSTMKRSSICLTQTSKRPWW